MKIIEAHDEITIDAIKQDTSAFDNYIRDLKQKIAQGETFFFGAEDDGSFLGRACLVLTPEEQAVREKLPDQPALVALQVNQRARRQGVATALVSMAVDKATSLGYEKLSLGVEEDNTGACALYEKLGFTYEGSSYQSCWNEPDEGGNLKRVCVDALLMVKEL